MHTIITENDESQWSDQTGIVYHFPRKYEKLLEPGTKVIYYKGTLKNKIFKENRLTDLPHYFAEARIGKIYSDRESKKGDLFATIIEYSPFIKPIFAKINGEFLEIIPETQKVNYWRNGVRPVSLAVFESVLSKLYKNEISEPKSTYKSNTDNPETFGEFESYEANSEGLAKLRYVTSYERNPKYRKQAIAIHGCTCVACGFNFGAAYGEYAEGFIHIHHVIPVSEFEAPKSIDPETDLVPLCANCHSVVHRKKTETLSITQLKLLIEQTSNKSLKHQSLRSLDSL